MLFYGLLLILPGYWIFHVINGYRKNISIAKATGIPYYVLPAAIFNYFWQATFWLWIPLFKLAPKAWTADIMDLLEPEPSWRLKFDQFKRRNTDMYLVVSSGFISLEVGCPEFVKQVVTRRADFPKYVAAYKVLEIYGPNVVSTEGQVWRAHRKITQPPFSERNNAVVWSEAVYQAAQMTKAWIGAGQDGGSKVETLDEDCMRLLLHVISRASFSVRMQWPGTKDVDESDDINPMASVIGSSSAAIPPSHRLSFRDALGSLLHNILPVLILPSWVLKYSPLKSLRSSLVAYEEWDQYQRELFKKKIEDIRNDRAGSASDLLGALVKGAGYDETISPSSLKSSADGPRLSEDAIMGNAFAFMIAGHETTANTTHYAVVNLAFSYSAQDALHADLDRILPKELASSEWDYETLFRPLSGSFLGAIVNETLRLWPPVTAIPKCTVAPQTATWKGKPIIVPKDILVSLHTPALHRYPGYWPTAPKGGETKENLDEFIPQRWFWDINYPNRKRSDEILPDLATDSTAIEASPGFFRPAPGSYIPFSDGARACLGRRFAFVEITAILAVMFQYYSVELDISDYLEVANGDEKQAWLKARERANWLMNEGSSSVITLQVRKGKIPIRFVKRGQELYRKYAAL